MCEKNIGRLDAYLRISTGIMLTSMGIMRDRSWLVALGSMKLAEGMTRYCPMLDLMGYSTLSDEELLEDLFGADCDEEIDLEHDCHCCCHDDEVCLEPECHCVHDDECDGDSYDDRRQYVHRGMKRNQYSHRNS